MPNPNRPSKFTRAALAGSLAVAGATSLVIANSSPESTPEKRTPVVATHPNATTSTTTTSEFVQVGSQELENGHLTQQMDAPVPVPTTEYNGEPGTKPNADVEAWKQALEDSRTHIEQSGAVIGDATVQEHGHAPEVRQG